MQHPIIVGLGQIQRHVQANYLLLTLRNAHNSQAGTSQQFAWEGNQLDATQIREIAAQLVEQAWATGEVACYESDATSASPLTVKVALVVTEDTVLGSLTLAWQQVPVSDSDTIRAAVQLLAVICQQIRQFDAQSYYVQALEYLGGLSIELNTLPHIDDVLEYVGHTASVMLDVSRSAVILVRDNELEKTHAEDIPAAVMDILKQTDLPDQLFQIQQQSQGTERTIVIGRDHNALAAWRETLDEYHVQTCLLTLLQSHNRNFGSLWLLYDRPFAPTPQDVRLFEIIAAQAAVALENIELEMRDAEHATILEDRVAERTRELAAALDKAEDADRLKTQLLSTVSHELRTPLAVIKAHISTLLTYYDRLPRERHVQYLTTAGEETDRLTGMINGLLDMSRLESGSLDIRLRVFEPMGVLNRSADLFQTRYTDRSIRLVTPESLSPVLADPERVWQLISNLVDNAAKYSPPGTEIEVGARGWDDALEIWVKDNGDGLTPEQIRRVFDRFYQVENMNRANRSGVGLGLAICKGLVEEMGGRIWCFSEGLHKGSKFAFTLPWAKEEEANAVA